VVEQAGHAAQLQQPQTVARLVLEFLDQHFG
jgi:pimeloyl-ACP methyl ester carboxylesterase